MSRRLRALAWLGSLALLPACAATPWPPSSPRVTKVETTWQVVYVRDGQPYDRGLFGGGLEDAVASNPSARERAQTYGQRHTMAQLFGLVAGGCAGAWMAQTGYRRDEFYADGSLALAGCAVAGIVTTLVFEHLAGRAEGDAIQEYNRPFADPANPR